MILALARVPLLCRARSCVCVPVFVHVHACVHACVHVCMHMLFYCALAFQISLHTSFL